jgi:hypothetical protein
MNAEGYNVDTSSALWTETGWRVGWDRGIIEYIPPEDR